MSGNGLGIGASAYTLTKQKHFRGLVSYVSKVAKMAMDKMAGQVDPRYWIIEMNAARPNYPIPGEDMVKVDSSAVIGPTVARNIGHEVKAVLIDLDENNVKELCSYYHGGIWYQYGEFGAKVLRQRSGIDAHVICGDSSQIILDQEVMTDQQGRQYSERFGYLYVDPNEPRIPLTLLDFFSHQYNRKIDLVINIAATSLKRQGKNLLGVVSPVLACKKKWLIREPEGTHQWTILVGTNWGKVNAWAGQGFYLLDSLEGQDILNRVTKTRKELAAENFQLPLLFTEPMTNISATPNIEQSEQKR